MKTFEKDYNNPKPIKPVPFLADAANRTIVWFICTIGVLTLFGLILNWLQVAIYSKVGGGLEFGLIVAMAAVGTPVHEFNHLIVCKLFGFKIYDVVFFRPSGFKKDGVLGYVLYSYDKDSIIDNIGCFFSGIAPLLLGGVVIFLVLKILVPEVYKAADKKSDEVWDNTTELRGIKSSLIFISVFFKEVFKLRGLGIVRGIIAFYVVISIAMHMTLSTADIKSGVTGLIILLVVYFIFGLITALLKVENYKRDAVELAGLFSVFMLMGLICNLIMLGIVTIL